MRKTGRPFILAVLVLGATWAAGQSSRRDAVVWVDFDVKDIPEPKTRSVSFSEAFFDSEIAERWKRGMDIPRLVRLAAGAAKQAANVNALDEVPDSSWFTNRHALRPMTKAELARGPDRGAPPDFTDATITNAKLEGVTPGLRIKDKSGESYLIKFDNKDYPELQSGAEMISTKILYAAGYNVPENYVGFIDPGKLEIAPDIKVGKSSFTRDDLMKMLQNAARRPDGTYRVLASKILKGKPKGPFPYIGLRTDDPNDIIPHEHRRELRGLRIIAAWINHWDLKEMNTLDMYVEESGRKFLRHYLIDFGSTLGGGKSPMEYFHGREYGFDTVNILKEVGTLGLHITPDEKKARLVFPEVGIFSADDFEPEDWKPTIRVMPFDNMTAQDAFWGVRIVLSFTRDELLDIVKTAQYSNPKVTQYVLETLLERRQKIADYWLRDISPLANFAVKAGSDGVVLTFVDLRRDHDLGDRVEYRYEVINGDRGSDGEGSSVTKTTSSPRIPLGNTLTGAVEVRIWTTHAENSAASVVVHVQNKPEGGYGIFKIDRSS